jgi:pimeloyl-ACP methyl ester carboxylesterase
MTGFYGGFDPRPDKIRGVTVDVSEGRMVDVGPVRLHVAEAGSGPLVVLLHGFPEFWYTWRRQIPALAEAGFRVVASDMRGYNLSDKPRGVSRYRGEALASDVRGLIEALGEERAHVVGHDWGGEVAWETAMRHPEVVDRLAILNVPHPARFIRGLRSPRQLRRSWYMFFFQLPFAPEAAFRANGFAAPRKVLREDPVWPGAFTEADLDRFVEAWAQPGAVEAMLNYYRAAFRDPAALRAFIGRANGGAGLAVVEAPTLVIWGEQDTALGAELAEPDRRWVPNLVGVERLPDASHWVQNDAPERVNELLVDFLR